MARSSGKALKYARREGTDLFLKVRGFKTKKSERRPGQHGARNNRLSNYGVQLREKQKLKRIYGITEKQFHNYYVKASRRKGDTGIVLLEFLESRLDNVIYRAGFAVTRPEARQLVNHGAIVVNGQRVNIPSFQTKPGSEISLTEKAKQQQRITQALSLYADQRNNADWITTKIEEKIANFMRIPDRTELPAEYNEQLIVELYSK